MAEINLNDYKQTLSEFLEEYTKYTNSLPLTSVFSSVKRANRARLRTRLQQKTTLITSIVDQVHAVTAYTIGERSNSFHETLGFTLERGSSANQFWEGAKEYVIRIINETIGSIDNSIIPSKEIEPILPIKDEILKTRCLDLLQAPGNFDRVINQATQVLEARLRDSLPYKELCELIPESKEHVGEHLANKLLSPSKPVIVISDKQTERVAFHKIVVGIIAYLRNPSHHFLDDKTEWALAWSVVGMIDSLLSQLEGSYIANDIQDNKGQTK